MEQVNGPVDVKSFAEAREVPYQRLWQRWNGRGTLSERPASHSRLSVLQEQALLQYCRDRDNMSLPVPLNQLKTVAERIVYRSLEDKIQFREISHKWAQRFISRHGLKKVKQKPLELARKEAHEPANIRAWFEAYREVIRRFNIKANNCWNFDETGFRIGIGGSEWVVVMDNKRRAWSPSETSRKHVTAVEAVNVKGETIEPLLIAAGKVLQERWFEELSDTTLVGVSDSGYMDDELSLEYIKHFERLTRPQDKDEYRLLIMDNYSSHCFREFIEYANEHKVVLFSLPPHTSHFLQPLDVVLFQPYKHYHRKAVNQATRTGAQEFGVTEFMASIGSIRASTFTSHNVRQAWKKSGLWPYNVEAVITFLRVNYSVEDAATAIANEESEQDAVTALIESVINRTAEERTPSPLLPSSLQETPHTVRTLNRHSIYLKERFHGQLSSPTEAVFGQFVTGAIIQAEKGAQAKDDLADTEAAVQARKRRNNSTKALQKGGVLYASNARFMVSKKQQLTAEQANRLLLKDRRKWITYKAKKREDVNLVLENQLNKDSRRQKISLRQVPYYTRYYNDLDWPKSRQLTTFEAANIHLCERLQLPIHPAPAKVFKRVNIGRNPVDKIGTPGPNFEREADLEDKLLAKGFIKTVDIERLSLKVLTDATERARRRARETAAADGFEYSPTNSSKGTPSHSPRASPPLLNDSEEYPLDPLFLTQA
jgi:hypothetical protein